jgi:tetratricopeptide (TPR) repeat protein
MTKQFRLSVQPVFEAKKPPLEQAKEWAKSHQEVLAVGLLLLLLLFFGIPYYMKSQAQTEKDAANMLNMAEYYMNSSVDPKNGPFKTEEEKIQQSLQTFQRILNNYSGTSAARASQYFIGKCQYLAKQYPQAYVSFDAAYGELKGTPLADAAALGKIYCMEAQENLQEALRQYESFLRDQAGSYLLEEARWRYSEALLKNHDKTGAVEQLKALTRESADTFWGREAARRMKEIGA